MRCFSGGRGCRIPTFYEDNRKWSGNPIRDYKARTALPRRTVNRTAPFEVEHTVLLYTVAVFRT